MLSRSSFGKQLATSMSVCVVRLRQLAKERWAIWAPQLAATAGRLDRPEHERLRHLLPYFSEQQVINDWQVAVILESLRRDHPQLREMTWDRIAADPSLVAKLYSGYMGAGGAWDQWRATLTPGPVARRRMELAE